MTITTIMTNRTPWNENKMTLIKEIDAILLVVIVAAAVCASAAEIGFDAMNTFGQMIPVGR